MDNQPDNAPANQSAGATPIAADAKLHCPSCGYNLTGLTSDKCPECGQAFTVAPLDDARPTTPVTWAMVGCRLVALYFAYESIVDFTSQMFPLYAWAVDKWYGYRSTLSLLPGFMVVQQTIWILKLGIAAGLWRTAPRLAQRIIQRSSSLQKPLPADGRMLITAGCVVVGLAVFVRAITAFSSELIRRTYDLPPRSTFTLLPPVLEALLGLWLIFGSGSLVRAIIYLRGLGPTADRTEK